MKLLSFSDNLLQDIYIIIQKGVDKFETAKIKFDMHSLDQFCFPELYIYKFGTEEYTGTNLGEAERRKKVREN